MHCSKDVNSKVYLFNLVRNPIMRNISADIGCESGLLMLEWERQAENVEEEAQNEKGNQGRLIYTIRARKVSSGGGEKGD